MEKIEEGYYIVKWNKKALAQNNFGNEGNFVCEVFDNKYIGLIGIDEPSYLCDIDIISKIEGV